MYQRMSIEMATRERYRDNVCYLFKMSIHYTNATPTWEAEGIPFRCNIIEKGKKAFNPMAGTYVVSTTETWLSDTQIDFADGDRVSRTPYPINDATTQDFGLVGNLVQTPINPSGNRYRTKERKSSRFTVD